MKIKMLKTDNGSQTGVFVESFMQGQIYEVTPELRRAFVEKGSAEDVAPIEATKNKMVSPKNKK